MNLVYTLGEIAAERQSKYSLKVVKTLPDVYKFKEIIWMGSYSFFFPQSQKRMIRSANLIFFPNGVEDTPPSVSRDYLEHIYQRGPRIKHEQMQSIDRGMRQPPNLAKPCQFDHGFYIDIKATYWNLMRILGWDPDYFPEKWLCPGRAPLDFPYSDDHHKIARDCLVSAGVVKTIPVYNPQDPHAAPRILGSKIRNHVLPRLIGDILNTIAYQAEQLGAVYAKMDGYIAPDVQSKEKIEQLIKDWGLESRVKWEGEGGVKQSGAYWVGPHKSVPYRRGFDERPVNNLHPVRASRWLQNRVAFYSAERAEEALSHV